MSREVKRVALDFDWPLNKVWPGYCIGCYSKDDDLEERFWEMVGEEMRPENIEPPAGDGWQMWEDCSEGSPISPVFKTPEELAHWLEDTGASAFGSSTARYDEWMATIRAGYAIGSVYSTKHGMKSGVEYNKISEDEKEK